MKEVVSKNAQSAKGLLSQGLISNNLIFTAGFIHMDENGKMIEGTVEEMVARIMKNIEEVLIEAGSSLNKVIKVTIYVTDMSILPELNKYYVTYFQEPFPVREAVCVKELPLGAKIEMSVVAEV